MKDEKICVVSPTPYQFTPSGVIAQKINAGSAPLTIATWLVIIKYWNKTVREAKQPQVHMDDVVAWGIAAHTIYNFWGDILLQYGSMGSDFLPQRPWNTLRERVAHERLATIVGEGAIAPWHTICAQELQEWLTLPYGTTFLTEVRETQKELARTFWSSGIPAWK